MSSSSMVVPSLGMEEDSFQVQSMLNLRPWMNNCQFHMITSEKELVQVIDKLCQMPVVAIDTETTGLNKRIKKDGTTYDKIVGWCLAGSADEGYYIPVRHFDDEYNLPPLIVRDQIKKLVDTVPKLVFHNFKFDGEMMRGEGIILEDPDKIEDTMISHYIVHPEQENARGLKALAKGFLGREMIEIKELAGGKSKKVVFANVPPPVATYYAASDPMCTLALYHYFEDKIQKMDPNNPLGKKPGPRLVHNMEKRNLIVTMEMERNRFKIDVGYFKKERDRLAKRQIELEDLIYSIAGRRFDIMSSQQLADLLFTESGMNIRYPAEKDENGGYSTAEDVLSMIKGKGEDLCKAVLEYRGIHKIIGTCLDDLLNNHDPEDHEIAFQLNPTKAATGRFSSTGGNGMHGEKADGYCKVNGQNIPSNYDPDSVDVRRGLIARPGFKLCAIDYSGEELRIATNLSKEPLWMNEFLHGKGDLHVITGSVITKKPVDQVTKLERSRGKTLNFLSLYGGGPQGFAAQAGITVDEARVALENFNSGMPTLASWKEVVKINTRKNGYCVTPFGRRRVFKDDYESGDRIRIATADRQAVNATIQGTGADILKLTLWRVWKHIRSNGWQDYVKILLPIHDEIVYEIKSDMLDIIIPSISEVMKMESIMRSIGWQVMLTVDAEYGDTFHVDRNYFKEVEADEALIKSGCFSWPFKFIEECKAKNGKGEDISGEKAFCKIFEVEEQYIEELKRGERKFQTNASATPMDEDISNPESVSEEKEEASSESTVSSPNGFAGLDSEVSDYDDSFENSSPAEKREVPEVPNNPLKTDYLVYEVMKHDDIAKRQTDMIWAILDQIDGLSKDEKKAIRLVSDGKILYTTDKKYSVSGFMALAYNYGI